ncbi:splicing factor, Prp19-binding domain-containing protein [Aspergillus avenaceus]|uniref:Splicing factor, Prp19-binding domain-containing protein n=1 Tax=Aspergillus avenaceus TaxID=36643 RepID=A0A5N6TFC6_ASPAV|nr:splicing factor, Prp19-binding domain-containing protein [Aspergillus avenaceus]
MPPPLPSHHRGMTANPLKPSRYRPGKAVAEEESSSEEEDEEEAALKQREIEERRRQERLRREKARAPKASSFPGGKLPVKEEGEGDEEGFVTEDEDESLSVSTKVEGGGVLVGEGEGESEEGEEEEEEGEESGEEEESSEEESSSEDEAPRVLLRPTFIKKDKRNQSDKVQEERDSFAESEARRAQRQEKADQLVREQLEKEAIARSSANKQWDDDEVEAAQEGAIDDRDGVDGEAEYAAWKLRELRRVKREREAIEEAEKEREEIERRRNLTAEERDREDSEYIARQKEEKEATRGQGGFMQRYFHKGAFFRGDLEKEGLDRRNVMGARFVDDVSRETLPEYMQIRDMTKLGKKGRTRYRDLRSEDTGRFGDGFENRRRRDAPPLGIKDERFLPDRPDDRPTGPTGANAGPVRERRRSRTRSPRRDTDSYRPDASSRRKRSPSPYDREARRRKTSVS